MDELDLLLENLRKNEVKIELEKVIIDSNLKLSEEFLLENVKNYKDVCYYLNEPLQILPYLQIKQIEKLFNGNWIKDFSNNQENWFPYFNYNKISGCLVFHGSYCQRSCSSGRVSFYKSQIISDFVGKTFADIYNKL